jgi:hypothetical protein
MNSSQLILDKIIKDYNEYQAFEKIAEEKIKESQNREQLKDLTDDAIEEQANKILDSVLVSSDSRLRFENLMYLIQIYIEIGGEKIPKEIEEYFNKSLRFKAKKMFVLEKNNLIPTDKELLENARNQLKTKFNFNQPSPQ